MPEKTRESYGTRSGIFGIVLNMLLAALKFIVGAVTNSIAITADALNNLTDCLTSVLTILGFKWAAKPADKEHPFGHSRIEYVVSLAIAAIILLTGYEVMRSSIGMIRRPEAVYFTPWAVAVLVFGMAVKLWMYAMNRKWGREIQSETLLAVAVDSRNDVLITGVTLFSLLFARFFDFAIDGYIGALIALVFLRSGYKVAREALGSIIGDPTQGDLAEEIKNIVKSHDGILGVHDLVVHSYGPGRDMASMHAEVAADRAFTAAHALIEEAAAEVLEKLNIELVVHVDPIDTADTRLQGLIILVREILHADYAYINAHEFRLINSMPKPRLVFDMELPHAHKKSALATRDAIVAKVQAAAPNFICEINIEYGFTA